MGQVDRLVNCCTAVECGDGVATNRLNEYWLLVFYIAIGSCLAPCVMEEFEKHCNM